MCSSAREKIPSDPVAGRVRGMDGRWSGIVQTENTVRHTKYGRIRGVVAGEGGRSTGVLLYTGSERPAVGSRCFFPDCFTV